MDSLLNESTNVRIAFELVIFRISVWECECDYGNLLIAFFAKSLLKALNKRYFIGRSSPAVNALSASVSYGWLHVPKMRKLPGTCGETLCP